MSILIKGMKMPKNCYDCDFHQSGYPDWCDLRITSRDIYNPSARQEWCPLVEVPDHGDLIDESESVDVQYYDNEFGEWSIKTKTVCEVLAEMCEVPPKVVVPAERSEE